jgi:hypothetical protein
VIGLTFMILWIFSLRATFIRPKLRICEFQINKLGTHNSSIVCFKNQ